MRNFKTIGLSMLKVASAAGRTIFKRQKKIAMFLFACQVCFIQNWYMENKNIWIHLFYNKIL